MTSHDDTAYALARELPPSKQISDNTGFNWYSIECMGMQPEPIEVEGVNRTVYLRTYLSIGTVIVGASGWIESVFRVITFFGTGTMRRGAIYFRRTS